jgi:phosphoribosyl-ATP pyrophosphohydrolase/phosphoribosyl-AMP cyclohydrolase
VTGTDNIELDFAKLNGLVPAVIQDNLTGKVLMLGFMNEEAFNKTKQIGKVTFFSRTKNRLWTKGEESGNFLNVVSILVDCDNDTLLIKANPVGPVCHTGADTCWNEKNTSDIQRLPLLQDYFSKQVDKETPLSVEELNRKAQMVGEGAIATVLEALNGENVDFLREASTLLYDLFNLATIKGYEINALLRALSEKIKSTSEKE